VKEKIKAHINNTVRKTRAHVKEIRCYLGKIVKQAASTRRVPVLAPLARVLRSAFSGADPS